MCKSRRMCIYNRSHEPTFRKWWLADGDNSLSSVIHTVVAIRAPTGRYALPRSSVYVATSLVGGAYASEDPTPAEPLNYGCPLNPSQCQKNCIETVHAKTWTCDGNLKTYETILLNYFDRLTLH
ncbi:hypothetical protein ALUC_30181S [Aspergillus luchuensis]|nr:hypothetical protein ALUC_30181S [Aspergillus luchuensis]